MATSSDIHIDPNRLIRGIGIAHADRSGNPFYSAEVTASGERIRWYAYTPLTARMLAAELRKTADDLEAHVDAQERT